MEKTEPTVLQMHVKSLLDMLKYCECVSVCRRQFLLEYFGEVYDSQKCRNDTNTVCDVCTDKVSMVLSFLI